jgi:hypothetical protein
MATANDTPYVNHVDDVVSYLGNIFDALDSISQIATAIISGSGDHVSLAKGIQYISTDMASFVDSIADQIKNDGIRIEQRARAADIETPAGT